MHIPLLVNGGWGEWKEWDACPVACGGAYHGRTRECDSPEPQHSGDDCTLNHSIGTESQRRNEKPCPSKLTDTNIIGIFKSPIKIYNKGFCILMYFTICL